MLDLVMLDGADRLIKAARSARRSDDVPQADAAFGQSLQSLVILEGREILADCLPEQSPKLIGRVRVVAPGSERRVTGKAAEHEQLRIGPRDRRQSEFDAH